jgi:hypothetical protein
MSEPIHCENSFLMKKPLSWSQNRLFSFVSSLSAKVRQGNASGKY